MSEQLNKFTDAEGDAWVLRYSSLDLLDAFHDLGVTLEEFTDIEKMNAGALLKFTWYGCRKLAKARGVSYNEFFEKRILPSMFEKVINAVGAALEAAFPENGEKGEGDSDPLPPGERGTSSN